MMRDWGIENRDSGNSDGMQPEINKFGVENPELKIENPELTNQQIIELVRPPTASKPEVDTKSQ